MKNYLLGIICLAVVVLLTNAASASVIGSYTVYEGPICEEDIARPGWITNLWFSNDIVPPYIVLFNGPDTEYYSENEDGIDIFSNIGKTFWIANDQDDPEFSRVTSLLTSDIHVYAWINSASTGQPILIQCLLGYPVSNWNIENLHGYTIDRIGLSIDLSSHNADPQSTPGIYTKITSIFEFSPVVVPEPAPFIILIAGISGLCGLRRKIR